MRPTEAAQADHERKLECPGEAAHEELPWISA
jgi:hypothetical protein